MRSYERSGVTVDQCKQCRGSSWSTMSLICPKCQSKMRSFERSGITVEQCKGCRGVFLDRGELDLLMAAEPGSSGSNRWTRRRPSNGSPITTPHGARFPTTASARSGSTPTTASSGEGQEAQEAFLEDFFE